MRISDWSSDVCSSDLAQHREFRPRPLCRAPQGTAAWQQRRSQGVFSLGYFSLDKQREVTRPWGENTGRANGERDKFVDPRLALAAWAFACACSRCELQASVGNSAHACGEIGRAHV